MQIHPSAIVSKDAILGANVSVGPFTLIQGNVEIGEGTVIESHCEIGHETPRSNGRPLRIGAHSLIRSHSVLYEGSDLGPEFTTGHRVVVREGTVAGKNLRLGTMCAINGDCTIGDYTRMHSSVFVGEGSSVGSFVWLAPYAVLTNDPHPPSELILGVTVEDYAIVAAMSVVLPGVTVGTRSLVAAHSMVNRDVPAGMVVGGSPAKVLCAAGDVMRKDGSGEPAYPWTTHFHRGYPADIVAGWIHAHTDE